MVRPSASGAVESGLNQSLVKLSDFVSIMHKKPASLVVVPLGKALSSISPSWLVSLFYLRIYARQEVLKLQSHYVAAGRRRVNLSII